MVQIETSMNTLKIFCWLQILSTALFYACNTSSTGNGNNTPPILDSALVSEEGLDMDALQVPAGFRVEVFGRAANARSMALSPNGTIFVGTRNEGKVYALQDINGDYKADSKFVLAENMRQPNGVAFKDGDLYVAEVNRLWKFPDIERNLEAPVKELIYDDYPEDGHHGWKYIAFGPDGKLYIPVGAPCNICESQNELYASITRINPDGSGREVFAHGIRNTVGFTWHPETGVLYFTDNGRDMLGDEVPPDELNRATEKGQHFGFPYCHGGTISDPEFGDDRPCEDFVAPVQILGPHVAALGVKFYTGDQFPGTYKGKIFIAEHGSWNRSAEAGHTGYRITTVTENDGQGTAYEPFIEGFLNPETNQAWGRPVDLLVLEDGSMLLSDDLSGTIYRISYEG